MVPVMPAAPTDPIPPLDGPHRPAAEPLGPPRAPRHPVRRELHGAVLVDDYAWMRDPQLPALRDYLAAERAYYDAQTSSLAGLAGELQREAAGRTAAATESVPWPARGFVYRTRMPEGREDLQFLRSGPGKSPEQVLLDDRISWRKRPASPISASAR